MVKGTLSYAMRELNEMPSDAQEGNQTLMDDYMEKIFVVLL
jgi:hypothetical protein